MSYGEPIDIGHEVSMQRSVLCDHGTKRLWVHFGDTDDHANIPICSICVGPDKGPVWNTVQREPLTLAPSIEVTGQGYHHGWIRGGKWVPA